MLEHAYRSTHIEARILEHRTGTAARGRRDPSRWIVSCRFGRSGRAHPHSARCGRSPCLLCGRLCSARETAQQPGRRAQKCAAATCSEQAATPSATSFPARRHCRMLQATPGSHRGRGILHRPPNENGSAGQALRVNGEERGPVPCSLSCGILFRFAFGRSRGRCDSMRSC